MIPAERRQKMIDLLVKNRICGVDFLAKTLYVSQMTVRRDLKQLEEEGFVRRSTGGAEIIDPDYSHNAVLSYALRQNLKANSKRIVAEKAAKLIHHGDTIFLDASSTTKQLTSFMDESMELTVITNALNVIKILDYKHIRTFCTGGRLDKVNMALFGIPSDCSVSELHIDSAFFSARGILPGEGIYDPDENKAHSVKFFVSRADKKYFLCDSNKIGKTSTFRICGIDDVDEVICDTDVDFHKSEILSNGGEKQ